jgi:hypothetical protein
MPETFEEQQIHEVQGIKSTEPQETMAEVRKRHAKERAAANYEIFSTWLEGQKALPDFNLPTLIIPPDARLALIPPKVYELANNPDNVEIIVSQQEKGDNFESLQLMVVERNVAQPLTNSEVWNKWQEEKQAIAQKPGLIKLYPPAPEGIDRLHAEFSKFIEKGTLTLSDRVLFEINLRLDNLAPQSLYVSHFDGEKGSGIGGEFYLELLPKLAKDLGFRFITGSNNQQNISFFTEKLGRKRATEIDENKVSEIFPHLEKGDNSLYTVQFLNNEDKNTFQRQSKFLK